MPIDLSFLANWRKRLGKEGMQKILNASIRWAVDAGAVSPNRLYFVFKHLASPFFCKLGEK